MRTGIELITEERTRQVEQEGWTPERDDEHECGELAMAAACYALPEEDREVEGGARGFRVVVSVLEALWPWWEMLYRGAPFMNWWKPGNRIRELTKAGALIAAEIDRLQRATESGANDGELNEAVVELMAQEKEIERLGDGVQQLEEAVDISRGHRRKWKLQSLALQAQLDEAKEGFREIEGLRFDSMALFAVRAKAIANRHLANLKAGP